MLRDEFNAIQGFKEGRSYVPEDDPAWRALKRAIYWNLNTHLIKCF